MYIVIRAGSGEGALVAGFSIPSSLASTRFSALAASSYLLRAWVRWRRPVEGVAELVEVAAQTGERAGCPARSARSAALEPEDDQRR